MKKVIRELALYERIGDKYIESYELDLSLNQLIELFNIDINIDPNVYMIYEINIEQFEKLIKIKSELRQLDFNKFHIYYECSQGPDWSNE